ncbi:type II toxin-antitoxin system RelE/ParE family toxin [Pantanalinema rosaneae CENA516]|uniref:type II toxin-antitoxin system RelE/ParE family toxin n=1 Tax=Pantanalinema rosaneae TaxID=1620701 RepID=UPI003D6E225B
MSHRYTLSGVAREDLIRINRSTFEDNPQAANRFLQDFNHKCQLLAQFPEMGVKWNALRPPLRSFPVGKHLIFYRPAKGGIEVVRVISGYQDLTAIFPELSESDDREDHNNN